MKRRTMVAVTAAASTALATALLVPAPAGAAASPAAIPNTASAWTAHTATQGNASATAAVSGRVYIQPRGGLAAEEAAGVAMATPGSATYHQFVTAKQYAAKYVPTAATVSKIESFLTANGLKVGAVGTQNSYVSFTGKVAAANQAFGTTIRKYSHEGQNVQAPDSALKVPASLASSVLTVTGLDTTVTKMTPQIVHPAGFLNARPCSVYYGQIKATSQADYVTPLPKFQGKTLDYAPCGYTGPQLRAAYEGNTTLDGAGVTVGIVDAYESSTLLSDAEQYASVNGDGSYGPGQLTDIDAPAWTHTVACGASGWSGEQALDVEAVHAMAPGANIRYYGAASCYDSDLLDALSYIVAEDQVQIVSNSYGSPSEAESSASIAAYESVFAAGAVKGISFTFSSGDDGDELANTGIKQVDYPTSDPYVTSVGGTSTEIGPAGEIDAQRGWGTYKYSLSSDGTSWVNPTWLYGAGGGTSTEFNKPAYQDGVASGPYRSVPDVAMDADPNTGMLIGLTQVFPDGTYYAQYRIGGTSLASPLFAGMTALALQAGGGSGAGLLNPTIYGNTGDFTDITPSVSQLGDVRVDFANSVDASKGLLYSVRTFGQDSSLQVTKGYDQVTGVGNPNPGWFGVFAPQTS